MGAPITRFSAFHIPAMTTKIAAQIGGSERPGSVGYRYGT
jgi:hypothetical protein